MSSATGLSPSMSEYVTIHCEALRILVEAVDATEFAKRDIPTQIENNFTAWYSKGIIQHTRRDPTTDRTRDRWLWEVHPRVRERLGDLERSYEGEPLTPCCGVPKWKNIRDGPFQCKVCDHVFEREAFLMDGAGE